MAVINGNDVGVYVEGTLIGCLTNATFNSSNEEIDVTCKDNGGARQVLPGGRTWSIAFEGFFNPSSSYTLDDLMDVHVDKTRVWVKMGDNTNLTITGYCYLNDITWEGPLNAGSTFSGTFSGDGAYTYSNT
jgi:predicted secreted protein